MKWKPVKGQGDMVRGVSFPDVWSGPRRVNPPNELGWQLNTHLIESQQKWGRAAAARQWASQARARAQRDANIGGVERSGNRMGPLKPLPTLTMNRAKPKSVMTGSYYSTASSYPARRG